MPRSTPEIDEATLADLEMIGEGIRSAVYVLDDDVALKAYFADVPRAWADHEARLTNAAFQCGAAAPGAAASVRIGSRVGIVMERIHGPSLWTVMPSADEAELASFGTQIAQAQIDLGEVFPTIALPHQWDRLRVKVQRAIVQFPELGAAMTLLGDRSERRSNLVCHGDLHLRNVLTTQTGTVLVDWFDASRGELEIEIARTLVMLDVETDHAERVQVVRSRYLEAILAATSISWANIEPWLAVQWTARIGEGFDRHRLDDVRAMLASQK